MKKSVSALALAALVAGAALAQDLTGSWQGKLQPAPSTELRIVIKLTKADGAGLKATMYSIDQGAQGFAGTGTQQGSVVKLAIPALGATYEGKLDSDGVSLTGTWTQVDKPQPLNLRLATGQTAWEIPAPAPAVKPMAKDANPSFEVATIKPAPPETQGKGFAIQNRLFRTINTSVVDMITFAYGVHARQVVGAPAWMESEKYNVTAKPDGEGQPSQEQWKGMLQKLLADRFQLKFHRDKKELSVYAITVGKGGPKLTKSEADPNGLPGLMFRKLGMLPARNSTMAEFAGVMQAAVLDRPVVDQTGIQGRYDFTLEWTPDEFQFTGMGIKVPPPADPSTAPPDLMSAMQEQLGLKLIATKAPAEVMVVDRVEKPSEN